MMRDVRSRRTVLKILGGGAAGLGLLGVGRAGAATPFEDELETARQATAKYRDVRVALQDGFQPGGPYVPGQGWHWINPERIGSAVENGLSLDEPQVLTYADTDPGSAEGHLVLGAVEWGLPVGARGYTEENPPDLFSDSDTEAEEHWHAHHSMRHIFASGDGEATDPSEFSVADLLQRGRWVEVPPETEIQPGDEVTADWGLDGTETTRTVDLVPDPHPGLLTLHAWVHLENRDHVLAGNNANLEYVKMLPNELMSDRTAKPD